MARKLSRLTRQDAQIAGSLEVGVRTTGSYLTNPEDTITTDAYFKPPVLTTTQRNALSAEEGMMVYDSSLGKMYVYGGAGWGATDGTAAGSLDAAYNGGTSITVDSGAVTLSDATTATQGSLLITKSGAITGANSASVFHINSTGAHDTSGDVKLLEISVGAETISGSIYGVEIAMNENTDSGITITKGAMTLTDGALTLTSGALTLTSGNFTMSSGNADITGTLAVSGNTTVSAGNLTIDGNGKGIIIDSDYAEAFLIREQGDAADVVTVDTTQDAADTTFKIDSKTTSGYALDVTTDTTTGAGVYIDGQAITSGDAVKIYIASSTMTSSGAALSVVDADNSDREVFAIRDDGSVYVYGTAEGTTAAQQVYGDFVVSDGDITLSSGELAVTTDASGNMVTLTNTNAGATGCVMKFNHDSASPADSDVIGRLDFYSDDTAGNSTQMAKIDVVVTDVTDSTEDSDIIFYYMVAGTLTQALQLDSDVVGLTIGSGAAHATLSSSGDYNLILQTGNSTTGSITITDGAAGAITIAPDTTGNVVVGSGAASGVIASNGNYDLTLQTGNATTSFINITDGAAGDIKLDLDSTGKAVVYNNDAGATGAVLSLQHESASPAASDVVGRISAYGEDASSNTTELTRIDTVFRDTTANNEDADLVFSVIRASALTQQLQLDSDVNGIVIGDGAGAGVVASNGNFDLTLQTGNTTTSFINITDGAAGDIKADLDSTAKFVVYNNDAGALGGVLSLQHESASPAASDVVGRISAYGEDASSNTTELTRIDTVFRDTTADNEDADLVFSVIRASTLTQQLQLDSDVNGIIVGDGAAAGVVSSNGSFDITIQTGNATTGTLTLTDGANGALTWAGNGSGAFVISGSAAGTDAMSITAGDLLLDDTDGSIFESENGTTTLLTLDNKAGVIASDSAVLLVDAGGAVASGGNALRVIFSGAADAGAILAEFLPDAGSVGVKIDAGGLDTAEALYIDADPTANSVIHVNSDGAIGAGVSMLYLDYNGTANATGTLLTLDSTGATATNTPYAMQIDSSGVDIGALTIDSDAATDSAVLINGGGNTANNKATLEVTNDGTMVAGSSIVRIESSTAAGGATVYGLEIACNASNLEGLYVSAGTSLFAEAVTYTVGAQTTSTSRTSTADGSGTGTIADGTGFVTVTSADANNIIILPTPTPGNVVWIMEGSGVGYELRSDTPASVAINGGSGANAESAIGATVLVRAVCTSATTWVCTQFAANGTESAVEAAAA